MGQYAVIREAVSTNIHDKREKNPSEKPKVAKPPRVFHEDFSLVCREYLSIPLRGSQHIVPIEVILTNDFFQFCRFGYFVFKQPRRMDYSTEGGYTDSCSANMSNGRGPFRFDIRHKFMNSQKHSQFQIRNKNLNMAAVSVHKDHLQT